MKISFIKTEPDARLPERNNKEPLIGDTGYDVYALEDKLIPAGESTQVYIGLEVAFIEKGYWISVGSRSGLFFKHGIMAFAGVIDCSYRGKIGISLINHSKNDYEVKKFDRIAQLVVHKLVEAEIDWADEKHETNRLDKGFGSSGR